MLAAAYTVYSGKKAGFWSCWKNFQAWLSKTKIYHSCFRMNGKVMSLAHLAFIPQQVKGDDVLTNSAKANRANTLMDVKGIRP
jgi:hypothetical protein